jgi:ATP-dependent DNA helicase RecQ
MEAEIHALHYYMIFEVLKKYWGFETLRPLQQEVIDSILAGRDSLTVLPTGGGKSLCYQLPAMCLPGLTVVVSPLIALMKDQVDALRHLGIPAAAINSGQGARERAVVANAIASGKLKLLYLAPERLLTDKTIDFLHQQKLAFIAIDEAHCISSWGHDFRPEYRELSRLRKLFPSIAIHAFTATATPRVREDIAYELDLQNPRHFVGKFHRPNLIYRAKRLENGINQICSVMDRFRGSSGIVYCITRSAVDDTSKLLNEIGYKTLPYHAGLTDDVRAANQNAFLSGTIDAIVATIAFGMGIDKPHVPYVVHLGMPRSVENYQQESGRAGRDGSQAECWLFYSPNDMQTWKMVIDKSEYGSKAAAQESLDLIYRYCSSVHCRHQYLNSHFGQEIKPPCNACDICLNEQRPLADSLITAQKILSCVLRVHEQFGADHVARVLQGSNAKKITQFSHQRLSTWGLLRAYGRSQIRDWIEQLVGQGVLIKFGEYQQLQLTELGYRVLRGEQTPELLQQANSSGNSELGTTSASIADSWEGVDRDLFGELQQLRMRFANQSGLKAFNVFSDLTLRDMARRRPTSLVGLRSVFGVGENKAQMYGAAFLDCIEGYCAKNHIATNVHTSQQDSGSFLGKPRSLKRSNFNEAAGMFRSHATIAEVVERLSLATSTVQDYLVSYVQFAKLTDISPWVSPEDQQRIEIAVRYASIDTALSDLRLKPIREAFHGLVAYEQIRLVIACMQNRRCSLQKQFP